MTLLTFKFIYGVIFGFFLYRFIQAAVNRYRENQRRERLYQAIDKTMQAYKIYTKSRYERELKSRGVLN